MKERNGNVPIKVLLADDHTMFRKGLAKMLAVRFDREPGNDKAEYAALVEDRWQDQGVGTELTRRLIDEARDKEVRFFYALVKGQNTRMLQVLRHLDLPEQERREEGVRCVEVELVSEEE